MRTLSRLMIAAGVLGTIAGAVGFCTFAGRGSAIMARRMQARARSCGRGQCHPQASLTNSANFFRA